MTSSAPMMPVASQVANLRGLVVPAGSTCFDWWRVFGYLPDGPNMPNTDAVLSKKLGT
jgi:hypothetical protein